MAVITVQRKPLTLAERTYLPQIASGLKTTWKHMFQPKVTLEYPEQRPAIPPGYRGVPTLVMDPHGREKCVSCQLCEFVCPPKAIRITPGSVPDGTGRLPTSPGPNRQMPIPRGPAALYSYRVLPYGDLADVVLLDVRRFAGREGEESQILGDVQWAWLERTLKASAQRARFRLIVNQVNLGQLRAFNLPFADLLYRSQGVHREHFNPNEVQLSTLISVKTGGCPEDCAYCPQSVHHDTGVADQPTMARLFTINEQWPWPLRPSEYVKRQFHVSFQDDPVAVASRHITGIPGIVWGSDYPHGDGVWPNSDKFIKEQFAEVSPEVTKMITCTNAGKFYGLIN